MRRPNPTSSVKNSTNNVAVRLFLGNGTVPQPSHLKFTTWYHPDICHYLLHMTTHYAQCITVMFPDPGYGNNTDTFKKQLQELKMLSNKLRHPALFISKEPGADNHFVYGVLHNNDLLLVNPLGVASTKPNCYRVLAELQQEKLLKHIWLSSQTLQHWEYEGEGLYSCGPIIVELALHILNQFTQETLTGFWDHDLKKREPTTHDHSGLIYYGTRIDALLPDTCLSLLKTKNSSVYRAQIRKIREKHLQQLETFPPKYAAHKGLPVSEYLEKLLNEAPAQVLFNALITEEKTIITIDELPEYVMLNQQLSPPEMAISKDSGDRTAHESDEISLSSVTPSDEESDEELEESYEKSHKITELASLVKNLVDTNIIKTDPKRNGVTDTEFRETPEKKDFAEKYMRFLHSKNNKSAKEAEEIDNLISTANKIVSAECEYDKNRLLEMGPQIGSRFFITKKELFEHCEDKKNLSKIIKTFEQFFFSIPSKENLGITMDVLEDDQKELRSHYFCLLMAIFVGMQRFNNSREGGKCILEYYCQYKPDIDKCISILKKTPKMKKEQLPSVANNPHNCWSRSRSSGVKKEKKRRTDKRDSNHRHKKDSDRRKRKRHSHSHSHSHKKHRTSRSSRFQR